MKLTSPNPKGNPPKETSYKLDNDPSIDVDKTYLGSKDRSLGEGGYPATEPEPETVDASNPVPVNPGAEIVEEVPKVGEVKAEIGGGDAI